MLDKIAQYLNYQQQALGLQAYRSEVLAGNMANAETPYYKAVDFDFASALKARMGESSGAGPAGKQGPLGLAATDNRHFRSLPGSADAGIELQYRRPLQPSIDGNTVDMDEERSAFVENAMKYQATLTFINQRISSMNSVLKG